MKTSDTRRRGAVAATLVLALACLAAADEPAAPAPPDPHESEADTAVTLEGAAALRVAIGIARAAMQEQDFERSRQILERVLHADAFGELAEPDRIAAWFALGQTANAQGEHREAVRHYRRILADHPGLVRVRLELARSLFLLHDDEVADHHFRLALAGDLPEPVQATIQRYRREIRQRRRWSLNVRVAGVGNTNINVAPTIEQIELFGLPFELDDDARPRSGFGVLTQIAGEYRLPLQDHVQLRLGGHVQHTHYGDRRFNDTLLAGHVGPRWVTRTDTFGDIEISLLAQGYRRWIGHKRHDYAAGPALELAIEPTRRVRLTTRLDHLITRYDNRPDMDGGITSVSLRPIVVLSPTSYATLNLGAAREHTDHERLRNWQYRVGLGYHHDLPHGFTIGLRPEYRYVTYDHDWPAFGARRHDHVLHLRADVLNRRLDVFGFTPTVGYRYQRRRSTIDLYEFDQHRFELGFTKQF
ncbi:MAG: surface lipoprotein assembly modifier [Phycisphaeraceae bacterium]